MKNHGPKTRQDNWYQMKLRELREENQSLKEQIAKLEEELKYVPFNAESSAREILQ